MKCRGTWTCIFNFKLEWNCLLYMNILQRLILIKLPTLGPNCEVFSDRGKSCGVFFSFHYYVGIELIGKKRLQFQRTLASVRARCWYLYIATQRRVTEESILPRQIGICLIKIRAKIKTNKTKKNPNKKPPTKPKQKQKNTLIQPLINRALLWLQKLCKYSVKWIKKNMSSWWPYLHFT